VCNYVRFNWDAASDDQTPAGGLSYNLRVGSAPGTDDIFSGAADPSSGYRRIPDTSNARKTFSWALKDLPDGTYYWSVQAIDTAFAGSAWAVEKSLTLPGEFARADFDRDCDVDQNDLDHIKDCTSGPGIPQEDPSCADAKLDGDDDVDQSDFGIFQLCMSGPNIPADPTCAD
jgi:hypothetical protein